MPRFFFHVHDGQEIADEDGVELAGLAEARAQAVVTAGEMLKDIDGQFWNGPEWRMRVTDAEGATVCTIRISGE